MDGDQENLQQIGDKTHQLEDTIKDITVSGGASTATAVSYNNDTSGMTAVTAQGAIDELAAKNKTQDTAIGTKAEKSEVATELDKKFDKENIAQEFGDSEDKVVSQFALPFREIESPEFIKVIVDANDHLLFTINLDGEVDWVKGIPSPIKAKLREIINQCQQDKNTLKGVLDKTTIKDEEGNVQDTPFRVIENEEFIMAIVDSEDKLLFGIYKSTGKPYYPLNEMYHVIQNEEYFAAWVTTDEKIVLGLRRDGEIIGEINAVNALKQVISKHQGIIESLQESILNLRTDVDILKDESKEIPSYYKEYLDNRIKEMDNLFLNYESYNDAFIFITDLHLTTNHKKSPSLISHILKYSNINKVFCGGDIPMAYGSKQDLLDTAHEFKKLFYNKISPFGKLYCIEGNHDFTIRTSREENTGYTFPMQFSRNVFCERMTAYPEVFTNEDVADALYYYIDNKGQKIRYIILNTTDSASAGENPWGVLFTFGKTQKDWVAKIIKDTPSNYKLVFMMHVPPITPEKEWYPTTVKFLTAIAEKKEIDINSTHYDFSNAPDVIMCLSGHMHRDECTFKDGLLWVDIACDAFYYDYKGSMFGNPDDYPSKVEGGNINEQTFDCIGIDVNDKKIDMIRIGGGYDRTFHYDVRQVSVGASLQLTSTLRNPIWMICDNIGNTLNSYTWEYSKNNASISEDGIVNGLTEGYSVVCAKDTNSKKMEFFGVQIIN